MSRARNIKRLISTSETKKDFLVLFSKILKDALKFSDTDEFELSKKIGKTRQQIGRYISLDSCNKQVPKLLGFRQLCIELQVDPMVLLGLEWVDCENNPESN